MGTIQAIFTQLGVDSSLLPQFIIIALVFVIARIMFLNQLQFILENREEKTFKLENAADESLEKVQRLVAEYKVKIESTTREVINNSTSKKAQIVHKYDSELRQTEKEINQYIEDSRGKFLVEIASQKERLMQDTDSLADDLVKKVIQ